MRLLGINVESICFVLLNVCCFALNVRDSNGSCDYGLTWVLSGGVLTITGTGAMTDFSATSEVPWIEEQLSVVSVVVEKGVTSIGSNAFFQFPFLTDLTIGEDVSSIGEYSFYDCGKLTTIVVREGNEHFAVRDGVLFDKSFTTLVLYPPGLVNNTYTIARSVKRLGDCAFVSCKNLMAFHVEKGNSVLATRDGVLFDAGFTHLFYYPPGLTNDCYTIPDGVDTIGNSAFFGCSNLINVIIPGSVRTIRNYAFCYCSSLLDITIPEGVTTIGYFVFHQCTSLRTAVIADSVSMIAGGVFSFCSNLINVTIGDGVTSIGNEFFESCINLKNVRFGRNVATIGHSAFSYCAGLEHLVIPENTTTIEDHAFLSCKNLTTIVIPDSVNSIGSGAFKECTSLRNISIPSGIETIEEATFVLCTNLSNVIIPESVTAIGNNAFWGCVGMTNLTIPDNVTTIGENAFAHCGMENVVIGEGVISIGEGAFKACPNLKSVFYQGSVPLSTDNVFVSSARMENVCVSPDYEENSFCSMNTTPDTSLCLLFREAFTQCYKGSMQDGSIVSEMRKNATEWEGRSNQCFEFHCDTDGPRSWKRRNATEWEDKSNACYEYQCSNESGPQSWMRNNATEWEKQSDQCFEFQCNIEDGFVQWSICNSTSSMERTCVNGQCLDSKTLGEKEWTIEIEMSEGLKAVDVNITEVIDNIVKATGISKDDITVGIEIDEYGYVVNIVLYVGNEETANKVSLTMDEMDKGEECKYGVLCRAKAVHVNGFQSKDISNGHQVFISIIYFIVMLVNVIIY